MANTSIYNAFERIWQHIVAKLDNKSNIDHTHDEFLLKFVQNEEPLDAPDGSLWIDIDNNGTSNNGLPFYTVEDESKFLRIVNGVPTWVSIPNAEGASF